LNLAAGFNTLPDPGVHHKAATTAAQRARADAELWHAFGAFTAGPP
jgi:hypothetical protein